MSDLFSLSSYFLVATLIAALASFIAASSWRLSHPTYPQLMLPKRSHCPNCQTRIRFRHLLPIISMIQLKGRCAHCQQPISKHYIIVESLVCLCSAAILTLYSHPPMNILGCVLAYLLILMAAVDWHSHQLPDGLTLSTLWIGLAIQPINPFVTAQTAVWGCIIGYGSLALLRQLYHTLRGQEGIGLGDCKLLAALGAWFGVNAIPELCLLASIPSLIVALILTRCGRLPPSSAIPFGPGLAFAGISFLCLHAFWTPLINHYA